MSTLKVGTIQYTSGGSSSTPEQIQQGIAKVWVNFDATANSAIRDSFNVSSIVDANTGYFNINFTNSLPSGNYAIFCQASTGNDLSFAAADEDYNATGSCRVVTRTDRTSNATDFPYVGVVIHGD